MRGLPRLGPAKGLRHVHSPIRTFGVSLSQMRNRNPSPRALRSVLAATATVREHPDRRGLRLSMGSPDRRLQVSQSARTWPGLERAHDSQCASHAHSDRPDRSGAAWNSTAARAGLQPGLGDRPTLRTSLALPVRTRPAAANPGVAPTTRTAARSARRECARCVRRRTRKSAGFARPSGRTGGRCHDHPGHGVRSRPGPAGGRGEQCPGLGDRTHADRSPTLGSSLARSVFPPCSTSCSSIPRFRPTPAT